MTEVISVSLVFGFLLSLGLLPIVIRLSEKYRLYDEPDNDRKIHRNNTPYMGGLVILLSFALTFGLSSFFYFPQPGYLPWFWLVIFSSYLIGVGDDFFELSAYTRFFLQFAGAVILIYGSHLILPLGSIMSVFEGVPGANFVFTVIVFSAITNAFNLIDGMDGLCGLLAIMASTAYSVINYLEGNYYFMSMSLTLTGSLAAFLIYNKPRAKIFLGDGGSYLVGVLISLLTVDFIANNSQPDFTASNRFFIGFALVAIPGLDLTRVFFLRIIKGRSPFTPDQNHIHHLFLSLGFSVMQTLVFIFTLATFLVIIALLFYKSIPFMVFTICAIATYVFLIMVLKKFIVMKHTGQVREEAE